MFYYSKISNYICNRRLRHSAQAETKVVLLLCCHCILSRLAVKLQDWRATYIILPSSMFYSLTLLIASFSRTQSVYL